MTHPLSAATRGAALPTEGLIAHRGSREALAELLGLGHAERIPLGAAAIGVVSADELCARGARRLERRALRALVMRAVGGIAYSAAFPAFTHPAAALCSARAGRACRPAPRALAVFVALTAAALLRRGAGRPLAAALHARGGFGVAAPVAALLVAAAFEAVREAPEHAHAILALEAAAADASALGAARLPLGRALGQAALAPRRIAEAAAAIDVLRALDVIVEAELLAAFIVPAHVRAALLVDLAALPRRFALDAATRARVRVARAGARAAVVFLGRAARPLWRAARVRKEVTVSPALEEAAAVLARLAFLEVADGDDIEAAPRRGAALEARGVGERPEPAFALARRRAREVRGDARIALVGDAAVVAKDQELAEGVRGGLVVVDTEDGAAARREHGAEYQRGAKKDPPRPPRSYAARRLHQARELITRDRKLASRAARAGTKPTPARREEYSFFF